MSDDYFHGTALNGVDRKGRVSIPADFRDVVTKHGGGSSVLIALHERADCLIGYDASYTSRIMAELDTRFGGVASVERDQALRTAFGSAVPTSYDNTGRIVLHEDLRDLAGIETEGAAYFVGLGDYFEIWNPEAYLASANLDPRLARLAKTKLAKFDARKGAE